MQITDYIQTGLSDEITFQVGEEQLATHVGSGSVPVLATPILITIMEQVCQRMLAECLPDGSTSVGAVVVARHLAPTPLGSHVRLRCQVQQVDGLKVNLVCQAWQGEEEIFQAEHQRVVIDVERFMRHVQRVNN